MTFHSETPLLVHLVARQRPGRPRLAGGRAARLWRRLERAFPNAAAAVLMPDHLHLLVPAAADDVDALRRRLARILGHDARRLRPSNPVWWPVQEAGRTRDPRTALRIVRYVALNPSRGGLVADLLTWLWSTYRDLVGAVAFPWVSPQLVGGWLPRRDRRPFVTALHDYVTRDPEVAAAGRRPPTVPPAAGPAPRLLLEHLRDGAAAALRLPGRAVRTSTLARRLFVQAAHREGWRNTRVLAQVAGATPRTVQRCRGQPLPAAAVQAARLCAADPRLRVAPQGWVEKGGDGAHGAPTRRVSLGDLAGAWPEDASSRRR